MTEAKKNPLKNIKFVLLRNVTKDPQYTQQHSFFFWKKVDDAQAEKWERERVVEEKVPAFKEKMYWLERRLTIDCWG